MNAKEHKAEAARNIMVSYFLQPKLQFICMYYVSMQPTSSLPPPPPPPTSYASARGPYLNMHAQ